LHRAPQQLLEGTKVPALLGTHDHNPPLRGAIRAVHIAES
jgi:quinol monooxygenase YgiN/uncharacterized protein YndB with AHSA1/START domain